MKYATRGFPVKTVHNCTKEEIHAALLRGPDYSALADDAIAHFTAEAKIKVASKRAHLVIYDDIRGNNQKQIKVTPIAAIPNKYKAFRYILELLFSLKLTPQGRVSSVNEKR